MLDTEIFVKTDAGRDEIRSRALGLPMSVRAILLMIDGQRPVSSMRTLIAGSKAPADVLDSLVAQGLIERRTGAVASEATAPVASVAPPPSPPSPPSPPTPPVRATIDETVTAAAPSREAPAPPPVAAPVEPVEPVEPVLDLVLPTIHGAPPAESPPIELPVQLSVEPLPAEPQTAPAAAGVAPLNAYEHLYKMMNEIVRDFLAPHRRYFFQLKIERCGTAEELLELLHSLQTALAKSRGEAFASDVIARLRSAAA